MGIIARLLGVSTKYEGQHRPGKHAVKAVKPPRVPKGKKK